MNFDIGFITELVKQFLGGLLAMGQVNTIAGQGILKFVDFFGALGDLIVRGFTALFGGLGG